jgi:hypothetical protein
MKVRILKQTILDGRRYVVGETVELDEQTATRWIGCRIAKVAVVPAAEVEDAAKPAPTKGVVNGGKRKSRGTAN